MGVKAGQGKKSEASCQKGTGIHGLSYLEAVFLCAAVLSLIVTAVTASNQSLSARRDDVVMKNSQTLAAWLKRQRNLRKPNSSQQPQRGCGSAVSQPLHSCFMQLNGPVGPLFSFKNPFYSDPQNSPVLLYIPAAAGRLHAGDSCSVVSGPLYSAFTDGSQAGRPPLFTGLLVIQNIGLTDDLKKQENRLAVGFCDHKDVYRMTDSDLLF